MKFIHVAVAVLSLLSLGQSAPVDSCESLLKRLEIRGRDQLLGRWTLLAETSNLPGSKLLTNMFVETSWIKVTAAEESDAVTLFQSQKVFGRCYSLTTKMTVANSTLSMEKPYPASEVLLNTGCPDCLVVYTNYTIEEKTYSALQLLTRRNKMTPAELDEYKKQAECLNLPAPAVLDAVKGFCPDESTSQQTESIDITSIMEHMSSDIFRIIDQITDTEGGKQMLTDIVTSSFSDLHY